MILAKPKGPLLWPLLLLVFWPSSALAQFQTRGEVTISEGAVIGTRKLLESSILPGRDLNGPFSILDGNDGSYFQLHVTKSQDGRRVAYIHLETRKKLDRELTPQFKLNISNSQGYLDLDVKVLDINDNPPVFDQTEYQVNVNESVPIGTSLAQVRAKDADEGKNAQLSYFMANANEQFSIDPNSGLLKVKNSLKCDEDDPDCLPCLKESKLCSLVIVATDGGQPRQSAQTVVKVALLDTNDHDPKISFKVLPDQSQTFASVNEQAKVGTSVAAITVTDEDKGPHGRTFLEITSGNSQGHFELQSYGGSLYVLRVSSRARFQRGREYNLTLEAMDEGIPRRSSIASLVIKVKEVNEFKPSFSREKYKVDISEAVLPGSAVINLEANDEDSNAELIYELVNARNSRFKIQSRSGLVTTRQKLDREMEEIATLKVKVSDGKHEAFTEVTIRVQDVNDEKPTFNQENYEFSIQEDFQPRQSFGSVKATDADLGENGRITYSIQGYHSETFSINRVTGELTLVRGLDRETQDRYQFSVVATDNGAENQLSSQVPVSITIQDVNDNLPKSYPALYFIDLIGELLTVNLKATDADDNQELTFDLETNDFEFNLDESSGELAVNQRYLSLVKSEESVRTLEVRVLDEDGKKSKNVAKVLVYPINDLKGNVFENDEYLFDIVEDSQLRQSLTGRQVGQVRLKQSGIPMQIIDGDRNEVFEIQDDGKIVTKSSVDREEEEFYHLTIVAFNGQGFDQVSVNVTVQDINDNLPSFDQYDSDILEVDIKAPIGHQVHRARVNDPDEGLNGKLRFMLDSANDVFSINQDTGIIELRNELSTKGTMDITVKVQDLGQQSLSNLKSYIVKIVSDENSHTPTFDFDLYEVSLSESTALNTEVITMSAIDEDDDTIHYAIIDNNKENKFDIFPDGRVYLIDKLDREAKAYYSVVVTATDNGLRPFARSSTSTLVIYVTDENDNAPILDKNEYVFKLKENSAAETIIGRVSAYDIDIGRNAEIVYRFAADNDLFSIDKQTGFISSKSIIDRENMATPSFDVEVIVSDLGLVPKSTSANVLIIITDENDNRPKFNSELYEASISESSNFGADVVSVIAKDDDEGVNGQIQFSLLQGADSFRIDPNSGKIVLQTLLDREKIDHYDVIVQAQDLGIPSLSSTSMVKINVLDENDNTPIFEKEKINIKLPENVNVGDRVYEFQAIDDDLGLNGKLEYFLTGNNLNGFDLNAGTGIMTVTNQLDRETRDHVDLVVTAVDNGVNAKTGSVAVSIEIMDVNDNAPVIQTTAPVINVKEGIPIGSKVGKIDASDPDLGENGDIKFSLKSTTDIFTIDSETGDLITTKEIDRETEDKFQVIVVAQDQGQPKRSSSDKMFTIIVEDINDNAPEFTSLNTALVLTGSRRGTPILTIKATDLDDSSNGAITYRLQQSSRMFQLDSISGQVTLSQDYNDDFVEPLTFNVIASDGAVPSVRKSSTATVTVIGGRPQPGLSFSTELYEATVVENSPVGTPVITLSLNGDPQERVQYFIVGCESEFGKDRGLFSIDKNSGQIITSTNIDRETEGSTMVIHVIALIGQDKMSGTKIKVTCQDENDSKPEFDKSFNIDLSEAYLPGHQLGYARASDPDLNSILSYSLGLASQSFLNIDSQSGELTLTSSIDREVINHLEVVVIASDGLHETEWKRIIKVQDINDNAPNFPTPQFSFDIFENVERGAFVGKIEAEDIDENDKITYNFISNWGLDTFSIDPASGIITLSGNSLDHESIEHYILTVSASDSGNPVLTATSTVYVNVKDINDNAPEIEESLYEVNVAEDVPIGTAVVQVVATDQDSESNTELQFALEDSVSNIFEILDNGTIVTKTRLDRETVPFFAFEVTVADSADSHNALTSTCIVQITIDDVNDQVPLFENIERLLITENSPPNTPVAAIRAIDKDAGKNAEIEYLLEDSLGGKFSIGRIDGVLRSVRSLDREEQDVYSLSVTALDNGNPRLSSRVEITVNVVDINDNPPRFEQKQYSASILENVSIGMDVLETKAYDLDTGNNGRLRFTILSGDPRGDFEINESSGLLRVAKRLDHERQNSYALTLQVEDSGSNPQFDTADVSLLVLDTNDNPPEFEHSPYTVNVIEEKQLEDPIFVVKARDRDTSSAFNEIEYSIRAGGQYDDLFHVNGSTGQVFVKSVLDREKVDKMTLEVLAIDSGSPRLTGTGTIYVVVEDINDHAPDFENDFYEFSIMENSLLETPVGEVFAYDKDSKMNGLVKYEIADSSYFKINETTGMISVLEELDREEEDRHEFTVVAKDSSTIQSLTSSATIIVNILDENDNRPSFDINATDYFIPPGLQSGDFVLGIFASDKDIGENAKLVYSLSGKDAKMFNLNRINGVLTASDQFEDKVAFDITVTVSDSSLRREARLSIYLAEELVVPSFDNGSTPPEINIDEDIPIGSNVVTFRAFGDLNEAVKYAVAGGNLGSGFDVDPLTGIVFVNQTLDYETYDRYDLWIKTFYETRPLFSAAKKISVVISDKNDNAPQFESSLVKVTIPEELYPPFDVAEVYAVDPDTGVNGEVKYNLLDDNNGMFEVDENNGLIKCNQQLDREVMDRYTLKLIAVDNGEPKRLSSTATVLLTLQDVNDNPPRFTRLYSINVTENTAVGTNLLKLETIDYDSPENAQVQYKFTNNPEGAFAIHESMGNISIAKNLDREIRDEYALKVEAFDGTWRLETVITVTIQDANDNEPVFDQGLYRFTYVKGGMIGRVHALDRDAVGPNSDVTYELSHVSDFFDVEEYSGEIIAKNDLESKTPSDSYQLRVIVKDGGSPPMSSECQVIVNLLDSENQVPEFLGTIKPEIGVPSSLGLSSVILRLNATDQDQGDKLIYEVIDDGQDIFKMEDNALKVMKPLTSLEGSTYDLTLVVKDTHNATDEEKVRIVITNDNNYSPEFQAPTSRIYIREDETVGNVIITVKATDQDQGVNGHLEYSIIKGDPENMFDIDQSTGSISVSKELDYEQIPVYNIIVKAEDRGFYSRSATSSVKIILQDINDNPPKFDDTLHQATLMENSPTGTIVTQMIANDLDSSKNADIVYDFVDGSDQFEIDAETGIVKALQTFDYELVDIVLLKVRARNPKAKEQDPAAMTLLKINIIGENEFYPRFKQPVFQFAVSESAQDSSLVGQVEAIDNDAGSDGEVFYYFVGASNDAGFQVDRKTGVITVKGNLDRESQNRYVLTVLAKNQGSIRGNDTDEAQVIIQVQDGNDPPIFGKSQYFAKILEDSPRGTNVVQVTAVDKDVRPRNSQFVYVIADGNVDTAFSIGSSTGDIIVETNSLDRETLGTYNLTVQAVDNGSPPAIGETVVIIQLEDVNDSPPELEVKEAFIRENSPPQSFVTQLTATDPDLPPNAGPFKFFLLPGLQSDLFSLDEDSGILLTKVSIDREEFDSFDLKVEVRDAGQKSSRSNLHVEVGDENDNPSKSRSVEVIIKNFEGTFPGGVIMNVRPDDPDIKGNYKCELLDGPENIFIVNEDCTVKAGRIHNGREYGLLIKINDGKHEDVQVEAKLNFVSFSEFAVQESVSIRFRKVESEQILGYFEKIPASGPRLVELLSMTALSDDTVECFVASRENDLFLPKEETIDYLDDMDFGSAFEQSVVIDYDPCDENPCLHKGRCSKESMVLKQTEITESGNTIFNSPVLVQNVSCQCQAEYYGDRCDIQKNPCVPNPCQEGGQCFQQGDSFRCLCPPLRGGDTCEVEKTNACLPNPCLNGGSCQNAKKDGFYCLCRPGYQGELCQTIVDTCRQNPCLNGGTCISLNPNYKCRCHDHFYGNHCEHSTYGFEELSFATFPPLDANTNDISVIFATSKPNSLLVYNFGKSAGGRSDFLSVELIDGHPRFQWGGSRTAITRLSLTNKRVDTGRWYKVTATRNNRVASLSVEDCTESGEYCKACKADDPRCFTKEVGEAGTLVFHKNPMFFGGLDDESAIIDRPGQLDAVDFVGCIRSISINGNEKNLFTESLNNTGLKDTCNYVESGSCSRGDECGSTGTCIPLWSHHKCKCGANEILALDCGPSFQPFTLTENQEVTYRPTRLYRHATRLPNARWKRELQIFEEKSSMSITFKTLTSNTILLKSFNDGLTNTKLIINADGILEYHSKGGLSSSNEVFLSTDVNVADGSWHTLTLEVIGNVLQLLMDDVKVGFEVEFSAVHNFMDPGLKQVTVGGPGFRGCITNFTLNNELQSLHGGKKQLLDASVPIGVHSNGCDVDILRVAQPQTDLGFALTVVAVFFVIVFLAILAAFAYFKVFKSRKNEAKDVANNAERGGGSGGVTNQSFDMHEEPLNNSRIPLHPTSKPDVIEAENSRGPGISNRFNDNNFDNMELYDIENASSIAPSDIDIVRHYKGFREGHLGRSLPKKKGRNSNNLNNTPLARLSPSSEMSHNTPRILTLKDLSGKPLPTSLLTEQSERSLNSPVSHFSSSSRHMRGGLTSENLARFNGANPPMGGRRSTTPKNSTLVNTLDLVSMGSGSRKKAKTPTSNIVGSGTSTSSDSSDDDNDDDSFTCSEYECDSTKGLDNGVNQPMSFSKLMDIGPNSRPASSRRRCRTSDEDEEEDLLRPPRPDSRSWENLLTWWPDYESFAGVFKDIAELPHVNLNSESDVCRPAPLGEHLSQRNDEEYI